MIQSHTNLMHRYTARHAVSLSSWILQPRTYDSESGQLPSLSSRTLLWEGEVDKSIWEVQGWSVRVSLFCFFFPGKDTITAIWSSLSVSGFPSVCHPVCLLRPANQSKAVWQSWRSRNRRTCRLNVRHHSFLASWDIILLLLPERY